MLEAMAPAELKPVYLIGGTDRAKVDRALQRLRSRVGEDAVERLSALETGAPEAVAACNAVGLFASGGRVVLVDAVDKWKAADVKVVAEYLASPAPDTVLALVADEPAEGGALAKLCAKHGELLLFELPKKLPEWVATQLQARGAKADAEACRVLVQLVGNDVHELSGEVDKLATWAAGDTISAADVEALVSARADIPPFALTDAWGRRDVAGVLRAFETLLERESGPRSGTLLRLAALLGNHIARVRACQALAAEGVRPRDAAPKLKMHPYAAENAFRQSQQFSEHELRQAAISLSRLDLALKGNSRLGGELEFERTLVALTRAA
jgi:DNA polymerase III delta subunit